MPKSVHSAAAIAGAILLWSTAASAQPCQYDKEVTFKGEIGYLTKNGGGREFMTLDRPFKDCRVDFVSAASPLPAPCKVGSPFTATGKVKRRTNDKGNDFLISRISCP